MSFESVPVGLAPSVHWLLVLLLLLLLPILWVRLLLWLWLLLPVEWLACWLALVAVAVVVSSKTKSSLWWPVLLGELAPIDSADELDELEEAADDKLVPSDEPVDSTDAAPASERSWSCW